MKNDKASDKKTPQSEQSMAKKASVVIGNATTSGIVNSRLAPLDLRTLRSHTGLKERPVDPRHNLRMGGASFVLSNLIGTNVMYGEKAWKEKAGLGDKEAKLAVAGTTTGMNLAAKHQMQKLRAKAAGLKAPSIRQTARTVVPTTGGQQIAYLTTLDKANKHFADPDGKLSPTGFASANAVVSSVGAATSATSHFINNFSSYPKHVKEHMKRSYQKSGVLGVARRALPPSALIAGGIGTSVSHAFTSVARDQVRNPLPDDTAERFMQGVSRAQKHAGSLARTARSKYYQMRTSQKQNNSTAVDAENQRRQNHKEEQKNQKGR